MSSEDPTRSDDNAEPGDAMRELEARIARERAEERARAQAASEAEPEDTREVAKPKPPASRSSDRPKVTMTRRRTSGLVALALMLFAFLVGLFAWPFVLPRLQAFLPEGMRVMPVGDVAETAVTDALAKRLDEIDQRLAALPPAATEQDLSSLRTQVRNQDARLAELAQRLDLAQNDQRFADLMKTHEDLSTTLRGVESRLAKVEAASPVGQKANMLALAATRLRLRAETARPFAADLTLVRKLAEDVGGLDAVGQQALVELGPYAEKGAPAISDLIARFPAAARKAQKASEIPDGAAWWRRAVARVVALITIRRTGPMTGDSVEAHLSRAEERLNAYDLVGAVEEVEPLEGRPGEKIDPWLQTAYARLAVNRAARALEGSAYRAGPAGTTSEDTGSPSGTP